MLLAVPHLSPLFTNPMIMAPKVLAYRPIVGVKCHANPYPLAIGGSLAVVGGALKQSLAEGPVSCASVTCLHYVLSPFNAPLCAPLGSGSLFGRTGMALMLLGVTSEAMEKFAFAFFMPDSWTGFVLGHCAPQFWKSSACMDFRASGISVMSSGML